MARLDTPSLQSAERVSVTYRALDGGLTEMAREEAEGDRGLFTSTMVAELEGGIRVGFTSGSLELGRRVAADPEISAGGIVLEEEYAYQNGTLVLGKGNQLIGTDGAEYYERGADGVWSPKPVRIGIWEGTHHSVHTYTYGGLSADIIALFDQFDFSDIEDGAVAAPKDPDNVTLVRVKVTVAVPNIGLLNVYSLAGPQVRELPPYQGTPVAGGELFVDSLGDEGHFFVLVSDSAITYVTPWPHIEEDLLLTRVAALIVDWKA